MHWAPSFQERLARTSLSPYQYDAAQASFGTPQQLVNYLQFWLTFAHDLAATRSTLASDWMGHGWLGVIDDGCHADAACETWGYQSMGAGPCEPSTPSASDHRVTPWHVVICHPNGTCQVSGLTRQTLSGALQEIEFVRPRHGLFATADAQLGVYVACVGLDRVQRHIKFIANLT